MEANSRAAYRPDIDGLRAIAVLSVIFFHAGIGHLPGGFTGVDIFFAISGFLIGGHIFAEESSSRFLFVEFYKRRAKRILPALFTVLLASLLLGCVLLSPLELRSMAASGIASVLSASNVYFWSRSGYFAVTSSQLPLLMTWSLGVEEQFYVVVPIVIVWGMRLRKSLILVLVSLTLLSFGVSCYQAVWHADAAFFLLPSRTWELLAGVFLAIYGSSPAIFLRSRYFLEVSGIAGIILLLLPVFFLGSSGAFPGYRALPSILGALLLLASEGSWISRVILSARPLRYVGRISYSLYLWHWPLLAMAAIVLDAKPPRNVALAILALSFLLAAVTYRWVEQPFRKSTSAARPLLLRYAVACIVLVILYGGVLQTFGLKFRARDLATLENVERRQHDECMLTGARTQPMDSPLCHESSRRHSLVLWGDSHAAALAPAMRLKAHESGYDFVQDTLAMCPPLDRVGRYYRAIPQQASRCIAFNAAALQQITADPHVEVVVLNANWRMSFVDPAVFGDGWLVAAGGESGSVPSNQQAEAIFTSSLDRTIRILQRAGKRVIVLQDVPEFAVDPFWRLRTSQLPVRAWAFHQLSSAAPINPGFDTPQWMSQDARTRELIAGVSRSTGAQLFDPAAVLCPSPDRCRYGSGETTFYADSQHLATAGAEAVLSDFQVYR